MIYKKPFFNSESPCFSYFFFEQDWKEVTLLSLYLA